MHVLIKFNLGLIDINRKLRAAEADLILSKHQASQALTTSENKLYELAATPKALTVSFLSGLTLGLLPIPSRRSKQGAKGSSMSPLLTPLLSMGVQLAMQNLPVLLNQLRSQQPPSSPSPPAPGPDPRQTANR
jgi:hypothetical protein